MFFIQMAVFQMGVVRALAPQDVTHTNFLQQGCTIQTTYRDVTFEDSVFFQMLFPPLNHFFSIEVEQRGIVSCIQLNDIKGRNHQQTWRRMELVLKDRLEVRFRNGSVWLKENRNKNMSSEPRKRIRMRGGHFMSNCPEETPNWTLEEGAEDRPLLIGEKEEVLSFFPNEPTEILFLVDKEELVLCWDATSNSLVVNSAFSDTANCEPLPAFTLFWLQLVHQDSFFVISNPGHSKPLRTFHLDDQSSWVTFWSDSVNGATYVVHHLKAATVTPLNDNYEELCLKVTLPVITVTGLLLLVFACLSRIYYHRWTKVRKVLYLLRRQEDKKDNPITSNSMREHEPSLTEPPRPPSRPLPSLVNQNLYLIPREVNVKSVHIYEDISWLPDARASGSHENSAFDNSKTGKD